MKNATFIDISNTSKWAPGMGARWWATLIILLSCLLPISIYGQFSSFQEISDTAGGFTEPLDDEPDNDDDFGEAVGSIGDLDGDGIPDIVVTAQAEDDGGTDRGVVWIVFLNRDGTVKSLQRISDTAGGFTGELDDGDRFGGQVGHLGDVDGDGITDMAIGTRTDDDGGTSAGAIWILFLNWDGTVKAHQKISATEGGFTGQLDAGDWFGEVAVSPLGDFDGDSVPDLVAGARMDDDGGTNRGAVWLLFLNPDGTVKSHQKISNTVGGFTGELEDGDVFGDEMESLGDLDGDGVTDIAAFAKGDDDGGTDSGAVWILFLNSDGTVKSHQKISPTEGGFTDDSVDSYDAFGEAIVNMGDLDGDGVTDIAIGADYHDDGGRDRGATWLVYLNRDGTVKSQSRISSTTPGFTGVLTDYDNFGNDGANVGDLNGDGVADLLVSADSDSGSWVPEGEHGHAAAYIFFLEGGGGGGTTYTQWVSTAPDRSNPVELDGETMQGLIYVFVEPTTDVDQVQFYIDGVLEQTERYAPYDLAGTARGGLANPYDTTQLADGIHTIAAIVDLTDGTSETLNASISVANDSSTPSLTFDPVSLTFTAEEGGGAADQTTTLDTSDGSVASYFVTSDAAWLSVTPNSGTTSDTLAVSVDVSGLVVGTYAGTLTATAAGYTQATLEVTLSVTSAGGSAYSLLLSTSPDRSNPVVLDGATVEELIYVFVDPTADVQRVDFYIDGVLEQTERIAPYDLAGTARDGLARPYDTTQLADGVHTFSAIISLVSGGAETIAANVAVANTD